MMDIRKIKIWLMRNRNLINFLKIVIIVLLSIFNNTNEKFVIYIFYLLIFDPLVLINKNQRFCKYLVNILILLSILVERLIYIANNYNIANLILSTLYIVVILIATKLDLIANRVKYNFTLWDEELKNIIKKYKILTFIKVLVITSMLLLVKVKVLIVIIIGIFNLFQFFLGNSETDKIKKIISDLLIFYISALSILFKADSNSIINSDMGVILGLLVVIIAFWIADNRKN